MPHQTVPDTRFMVFLQVTATTKQEKGKELGENKAVLDLEKILKKFRLRQKKRVSCQAMGTRARLNWKKNSKSSPKKGEDSEVRKNHAFAFNPPSIKKKDWHQQVPSRTLSGGSPPA